MDNRKKFLTHLRESRKAVWTVAEALFDQGFSPTINCSGEMPEGGNRVDYVDDGDLHINLKIEVKHRKKLSWTCREDFPYPDLFICAKRSFDFSFPKPYAYINLNDSMSHVAIIYSSTRPHWEEFNMPDKRYGDGYVQKSYRVSTDHVVFGTIGDDLLDLSSMYKEPESLQ